MLFYASDYNVLVTIKQIQVVYFTMLYYLLVCSGDQFMPIVGCFIIDQMLTCCVVCVALHMQVFVTKL